MLSTRRGFMKEAAGAVGSGVLARAANERPNIIFILLDDVRKDELHCTGHPFVRTPHIDRLGAEGVSFRNAFVTTPLCSPSRASYFTGQYAHTHGVTDNTDHSPLSHRLMTFPRLMQGAGYETAFIGKWHMGVDDSPRPGFDRWVSFKGQGSYLSPEVNVDGKEERTNGYATDVFTDFALEFMGRKRSRPFLLCLSHKAVHPEVTQYADGHLSDPNGGKFIAPERYKNMYAGAVFPRCPNFGKAQGIPALERSIPGLPPLGPSTGTDDETIRNRARMITAVDDGVGRMLAQLQAAGELDRTLVVLTSDEGYFFGEHGLSAERRLAYEESIRIPLLMRYPRLIRPGSAIDGFALNIDMAPTFLEMAGIERPAAVEGRSLVPLLRGGAPHWRDSFVIEYFSDTVFPRIRNMGYQAIRTDRWKFIRYKELRGMDELYDLQADRYEMHNLMRQAEGRRMSPQLSRQLDALLGVRGVTLGQP